MITIGDNDDECLTIVEQPTPDAKRVRKTSKSSIAGQSQVYTYGFLRKAMLPFRQRQGDDFQEPGLPFDIQGYEQITDRLVASWPDGHSHEIALTVGEYHDLVQGGAGKRQADEEWTTSSQVTGNRISIRQKRDHDLLLVLCDQNKYCVSVKAKIWGCAIE